VKTAAIALAPLAFTPLLVLLLMEFGPERSVLFAIYWIVPAIVFAIAMPLLRRRGRNLFRASLLGAAWALGVMVVVFTVALVASLYFVRPAVGAVPPRPLQSVDSVRAPGAGSATRTAVLDAVRRHVRTSARFKVSHVRTTDRWAFVRCVEVVDDGESLQETDLDIAALLERRGAGSAARWVVVELWSLTSNEERPYTPFARRVRDRARELRIPAALFPIGFLASDVPVG
jgi:hypothetical protein